MRCRFRLRLGLRCSFKLSWMIANNIPEYTYIVVFPSPTEGTVMCFYHTNLSRIVMKFFYFDQKLTKIEQCLNAFVHKEVSRVFFSVKKVKNLNCISYFVLEDNNCLKISFWNNQAIAEILYVFS